MLLGRTSGSSERPVLQLLQALPAINEFQTHISNWPREGPEKTKFPEHVRDRGDEEAYAIGALAILRARKQARTEGLELVGAYHSHVHADADFSPLDRALALDDEARPLWPRAVFLVFSLLSPAMPPNTPRWRAFTYDAATHDFRELGLQLS